MHFLICFFMWLNLHFYLVDIIFKVSFFHGAIGEGHLAVTVLDTSIPLALVPTTVSPTHLSVSMTVIFEVLALVLVTTCPNESTEAMLAIILVFTVINVAGRALCASPFTLPVFHSCFEQTDISGSIRPCILAFALWLSV